MRFLKAYAAISAALFVVCYGSYCFVTWSIPNPFAFYADIPEMTSEGRGAVLFWHLTIMMVIILFAATAADLKPGKKRRFDDAELAIRSTATHSNTVTQPEKQKSPDAADIAVGVGAGIVGAEAVTSILGIDD